MMPNHNDIPYNMIKKCLTKPLMVKVIQREAEMVDGKMCSFQNNI